MHGCITPVVIIGADPRVCPRAHTRVRPYGSLQTSWRNCALGRGAAQKIQLMGDVDQLAALNLGVALGDPLPEAG